MRLDTGPLASEHDAFDRDKDEASEKAREENVSMSNEDHLDDAGEALDVTESQLKAMTIRPLLSPPEPRLTLSPVVADWVSRDSVLHEKTWALMQTMLSLLDVPLAAPTASSAATQGDDDATQQRQDLLSYLQQSHEVVACLNHLCTVLAFPTTAALTWRQDYTRSLLLLLTEKNSAWLREGQGMDETVSEYLASLLSLVTRAMDAHLFIEPSVFDLQQLVAQAVDRRWNSGSHGWTPRLGQALLELCEAAIRQATKAGDDSSVKAALELMLGPLLARSLQSHADSEWLQLALDTLDGLFDTLGADDYISLLKSPFGQTRVLVKLIDVEKSLGGRVSRRRHVVRPIWMVHLSHLLCLFLDCTAAIRR